MVQTSAHGSESHTVDSGEVEIRWDGPIATVFSNDVEPSAIHTGDPSTPESGYVQHVNHVLGAVFPAPQRIRAFRLGGVTCVLPLVRTTLRPGLRHSAVEIDPGLAGAVRDWFDLPRSSALSIWVGDARVVMCSMKNASPDAITRDTFDEGKVPTHLRATDFVCKARRALKSEELFLLNCAHGGGEDTRCEIISLREELPQLYSIQDPKVGRSGRCDNVLVVTSNCAYPIDELNRQLHTLPLPTRVTHGRMLEEWCVGAKPFLGPEPSSQGAGVVRGAGPTQSENSASKVRA